MNYPTAPGSDEAPESAAGTSHNVGYVKDMTDTNYQPVCCYDERHGVYKPVQGSAPAAQPPQQQPTPFTLK